MASAARPRQLTVSIIAGLVRVALGAFWLNEGLLKYRAGFGRADILLVANSAMQNSRVPGFYKDFAATVLTGAPGLFGWGIPLLETALGVVLILGFLTLPAALGSIFTLLSYWYADQLIVQYPIMVMLSAVLVLIAGTANRLSISSLAVSRLARWRPAIGALLSGSLRRWV